MTQERSDLRQGHIKNTKKRALHIINEHIFYVFLICSSLHRELLIESAKS